MSKDMWYILAASLVWGLVILLLCVLLLRICCQHIANRRRAAREEAEALRTAQRFASASASASDTASQDGLTLEPRLRGAITSRTLRRFSSSDLPAFPPRLALALTVPAGVRGLSREELQVFAPIVVHVADKDVGGGEEGESAEGLICAVCLDEVADGSRKRVLPCRHGFHARCVQIWLQRSNRCPCCMIPVASLGDPRSVMLSSVVDFEELGGLQLALAQQGLPRQPRRGPGSRFLALWTFGNGNRNRNDVTTELSRLHERALNSENLATVLNQSETATLAAVQE